MTADKVDAGIVTFQSTHPKWSFAKVDNDGNVTEVAEKNPISDKATAGIYFWLKGSDYVKYAEQMIAKNIRVKNEFYVCPVFNEAIADGKRIKTFDVPRMWGTGTPEDLNHFTKNYHDNHITQR
jgi:dTDP-glucose pyrophosphorylase